MAIASDMVTAEVIDADEFRELALQFGVGPVPKTVLNYRSEFVGAAPASFLLEKVLSAPPP